MTPSDLLRTIARGVGQQGKLHAQREAVANLTTYCERVIERGKLPALDQLNLLNFVNETCVAFEMEKIHERDA